MIGHFVHLFYSCQDLVDPIGLDALLLSYRDHQVEVCYQVLYLGTQQVHTD